jgi:hypothetical protein
MRPRSILIVVVLPAPFGPTNPQTAPPGMARLTPSTTVRSPKRFVSLVVDTASDDLGGSPVRHVTCVNVMPGTLPRRPRPGVAQKANLHLPEYALR